MLPFARATYGGLDLAVREVLGGELAWVADNDQGAAALLAHHYPDVPNLGDVTTVDWDSVEQVDLMCGGTPCQDVSQAGARAGLQHGNRSGLWHEFVKAIAAHRPRLVVIENVLGLLTARGDEPSPEHLAAEASRDTLMRLLRWPENELALAVSKRDTQRARRCRARIARLRKHLKRAEARCQWHEQRLIRAIGTVLASLAGLGYDAEWVVVTASAAGACHRRARLFILAFPAGDRVVPVTGDPVAVIEDGVWLEARETLFGMAPFTGRVPASGRMAGGRIYTAEPGPTAMADGGLLKTPTAQLAVNGGSQHPDKRRAGGHGPTLADQVEHELLPTPMTSYSGRSPEEWRAGRPAGNGATRDRIGDLGIVVEHELLPTPTAADGDRTSAVYPRGNETLLGALLPTPNAARVGSRMDTQVSGDGRETPNKLGWAIGALLPTPSVADGTGGHTSRSGDRKGEPLLGGIAQLLPTPTAMDSAGSRNATANRAPGGAGHAGTTLCDVFWDGGKLLPTPAAGNFNDGESAESWQQRKDFHAAKEADATRAGMPLTVAAQQLAGGVDWGPYEAAIRRWETVLDRLAPQPTVPGKTGERLNPALPEWMQGLPAGWITAVPGLSRNAMLKLAGNGVVPQQGALALRILLGRAGINRARERAA